VRIMTEALRSGVMAFDGTIPSKWVVRSLVASRRLVDDRLLHLADNPTGRLAVLHLHASPDDGVDRHAFDLPAAPRRRVVLAVQLVWIDGGLLAHIHDGEIAVGAEPDGPFFRVHLPHLGDIL